jgi:hypothetical protein
MPNKKITNLKVSDKDKRDYTCSTNVDELPKKTMIEFMPPIRQQSSLSSCASHAAIALNEIMLLREYGGSYVDGSELYHYYYARKLSGSFPKDTGMTMRDACATSLNYGFAPEKLWKYSIFQL